MADVVWQPQAGSQELFLSCPVYECLYEGTRGPGKTDALLMDFAQHCGKGYGIEWRGILFRQTYPQLSDIISKTQKWFPQIFPRARFNKIEHTWTWPDGEQLLLRHMKVQDDYWNYHGHAYPWIGWEELTNWPDDACYKVMMSCSRSTHPTIPRKYRATTNPYGIGHNWVKDRFGLPAYSGQVIRVKDEMPRTSIHGSIHENKILLNADPQYIQKIRSAARNPSEEKAWIEGSWDIVAGGMFDDVWSPKHHILPDVPFHVLRKHGWKADRSFDWGSSKPFSVGWWMESNGEPLEWEGKMIGPVKGDLIRINEWYGWTGHRNEGLRYTASQVGHGIIQRESGMNLLGRVRPGPADSSIYDLEDGNCVADNMKNVGVRFVPADKKKGSRKQGWEKMRQMFVNSIPAEAGYPREEPGLFVMSRCKQFIITVPSLPRDDKDLDDVDTNAEDHIGDDTRYRTRAKLRQISSGSYR